MDPRVDMRFLAPSLCSILGQRAPGGCEVEAHEKLAGSMKNSRSVLVVVFDGFGKAALDRHAGMCPNLELLMGKNRETVRAVPPPKTPVNFATMATGASQERHGIGVKTDPLEIETIFQVLEEAGLSTCVAGRQSGSPANLFSRMVTYAEIAQTNKDAEVLQLLLDRLGRSDPELTLVQFLDIDNAGHRAGPFGEEASRAIFNTDSRLGELMRAVAGRGCSIIALADHGQHEVTGDDGGIRGKHDGSSEEDFLVPLAWCGPGELDSLAREM